MREVTAGEVSLEEPRKGLSLFEKYLSVWVILCIVAGIILGIAVTYYFQIYGIDFSGSSELLGQFGISGRMFPRLSVLSIVIGPGLVLMITILAALYPAIKVRALRPVQALAHA